MTNTIKALSKQFFGAKYESARKSLLAAVILFAAVYAADFRVEIAPFILCLTSTFFTAGVMWQVLTGRRHMEAMQGMFMLPFDNRSFVFSYVLVLGAHTLITKNAADLDAVLRRYFMERMGNYGCNYLWLYGVCGDSGGVSDVPERSGCTASSLGCRYFDRNCAGTPMDSDSSWSGGKHDSCGAISGLCGCL